MIFLLLLMFIFIFLHLYFYVHCNHHNHHPPLPSPTSDIVAGGGLGGPPHPKHLTPDFRNIYFVLGLVCSFVSYISYYRNPLSKRAGELRGGANQEGREGREHELL